MKRSELALLVGSQVVIALLILIAFRHLMQSDPSLEPVRTRYPECHPRPLDSRSYCEVLGSDLFSASERMHGRDVSLTGFLANDDGVLTLFPSETEYRNRVNTHALVLRAPYESQKKLLAEYGYGYVKLFGTYSSKDKTSSQFGKVGSLRVLHADPVKARGRNLGTEELGANVEDVIFDPKGP